LSRPQSGSLQISVHTDAVIAAVHAQRGDADRARRALASTEQAPREVLVPFDWWIDRALVWTMAAEGDVGAAITRSVELADRQGLELFYAAVSLHDVVRLGRAAEVVERLSAMAVRRGATWLEQTYAAHAVAATEDDAPALLAVSEQFEEGGLDLDALESAAQAASASVDRPGLSSIARSRAQRLELVCGTVRTPALEMRPPWLTEREIEVSRLAARGWTNGRIADRLGTSKRTIGNQLQSTYQKLGINSRADLRPLFRLD
jgi:DNA-binding CsgD family transcriptional regulator